MKPADDSPSTHSCDGASHARVDGRGAQRGGCWSAGTGARSSSTRSTSPPWVDQSDSGPPFRAPVRIPAPALPDRSATRLSSAWGGACRNQDPPVRVSAAVRLVRRLRRSVPPFVQEARPFFDVSDESFWRLSPVQADQVHSFNVQRLNEAVGREKSGERDPKQTPSDYFPPLFRFYRIAPPRRRPIAGLARYPVATGRQAVACVPQCRAPLGKTSRSSGATLGGRFGSSRSRVSPPPSSHSCSACSSPKFRHGWPLTVAVGHRRRAPRAGPAHLVVMLPGHAWNQAIRRVRSHKKVGRKVCAQLILSIHLILAGLRLRSIGRLPKVAARPADRGPYSLIVFGTEGRRSPLFAPNAPSYGGGSSVARRVG